jgi:hypothetical protein
VAINEQRATAAIDAIMKGWSDERTRRTLQVLLAWSATAPETARWTTKLTSLRPPQSRADGIATVVEVLKYPPVAGPATDQLLNLLKAIDPNAPAKDGGLPATLRWIAETYPGINLDARPACPAPPSSSLTCPSARH